MLDWCWTATSAIQHGESARGRGDGDIPLALPLLFIATDTAIQGCCASRPAGDGASPYPPVLAQNEAPDSSSRNITSTTPPRSGSLSSPQGSHHHHHAHAHAHAHLAPSGRPNVPLKPIDPSHRSALPATLASPAVGSHRSHVTPLSDSVHAQWTRKRLEKERNDWWDTRTTGSAEIWRALRLMVESLQAGDVGEAQALLDATECTCPNGMLWRGVFDGRGEWYRVPEWVVIEPEGLVEDEEVQGNAQAEGDKEGDEEAETLGEPVKVRCRLSTTSQDYSVNIRRGERVASLISKLKRKAEVR